MSGNTSAIYYEEATVRDGYLLSQLSTTAIPVNDSAEKTVQASQVVGSQTVHAHALIPFDLQVDAFGLDGVPTGRTIEAVTLSVDIGGASANALSFEIYEIPPTIGGTALLNPSWQRIAGSDRWTTFGGNGSHVDDGTLLDTQPTVGTGAQTLTFTITSHSLLNAIVIGGTISFNVLIRAKTAGWANFKAGSAESGRFRIAVQYSGTQPAGPDSALASVPTSKSFGSIETGQTSTGQAFAITNNGAGDATISSVALVTGTHYTIDSDTGETTLATGATRTVTCSFAPGTTGALADTLRVASNDPATPLDIALTGTGIAPFATLGADPASVTFPITENGSQSATTAVDITNSGNGTATISSVALVTGTNFSITADTAEGTLATGATRTVTVRFDPTATGSLLDTLRVASDDPATPLDVALSGVASAAASIVEPLLSKTDDDHPKATLTLGYDRVNNRVEVPAAGIKFLSDGTIQSTAAAGGLNTMLGMTDTPGSYVGTGLYLLRINAGETAIEFVAVETATGIADTDDVSEGATNQYYTSERVMDAVAALIVGGSNVTVTYDDTANTLTIAAAGGADLETGSVKGDILYSDAAGSLANLGIGTLGQVLEVSGGGIPAWVARLVDLASEVTGLLPLTNGGTGSGTASGARTNLGVDAAGTDNSTDVTLAGTPDYLTLVGQVITRGLIDLTTDVTGDLPVTEGGTGSSTAVAALAALGAVDPAGVAGGQTITGGNAASENLDLKSTSHATKGLVRFPSDDIEVGDNSGSPKVTLRKSGGGTALHEFRSGGGNVLVGSVGLDANEDIIVNLDQTAFDFLVKQGATSLAKFLGTGGLEVYGDAKIGDASNTKVYTVTSSGMTPDDITTGVDLWAFAGYWITNALTGGIVACPCPHSVAGSVIKGVRLYFFDSDGANNLWTVYARKTNLGLLSGSPTNTTIASEVAFTADASSNATEKGTSNHFYYDMTLNHTIVRGDSIMLSITMDPDTVSNSMRLYAVDWEFEERAY